VCVRASLHSKVKYLSEGREVLRVPDAPFRPPDVDVEPSALADPALVRRAGVGVKRVPVQGHVQDPRIIFEELL